MAGVEKVNDTIENNEASFDNLAYRYDLKDAIGVIVLPPKEIFDKHGSLQGDRENPSSPIGKYFGEFRKEIENVLDGEAAKYAPDIPLDRKIPSHLYAQPPAAQGTFELAFWLWEHGPSVLMTLDAAINVGKAIQAATNRIRRITFSTDNNMDGIQGPLHGVGEEVRTYWSQASVMAVVVADAASRYGIADDIVVSVFPRGSEYLGGPDHPNPHINYMVRIDDGPRTLIYCVLSDGRVVEHFQLAGDRITPLELPQLIDQPSTRVTTFPAQQIRIKTDPN